MKSFLLKSIAVYSIFLFHSIISYSQYNISIDVSHEIKSVSSNSLGINVDYLMDGSYISSGTTSATAQSLKKMGMKMLRYPGGEKSDNYKWSSFPFLTPAPATLLTGDCNWPSGDPRFVESNRSDCKPEALDFDEFIALCREAGAEPMIVCAYDAAYYGGSVATPNPCGLKPTKQQLVEIAKEWVRYANITKDYKVKYWSIGNESWNDCTYNGCVTATQYAADIIEFATAMRSVDPSIKIIVNGLGEDWWRTLLQNTSSADAIDYLGVSCYPVNTYTGGYEYYRSNNPNLTGDVADAANAIDKYASANNKSRIKVLVTEVNSIDWNGAWPSVNDVGHALVACEIIGRCFENKSVESTLFWNTRWIDNDSKENDLYDALDKNSGLNANGLMLSAWASAILPRMLHVTQEGYVKAFAFHDSTQKKINAVLINKDNSGRTIQLSIPNLPPNYTCLRWEYKGSGTSDTDPSFTLVDSAIFSTLPISFSLPPNSVTVLKFSSPALTVLAVFEGYFNVNLNRNNTALLNWQAIRRSTSIYRVEKSSDGISWTSIALLKPGISGSDKFTFEDSNPFRESDLVYYRIVEENEQGHLAYSESKLIRKPASSGFAVRLLNNPVREIARFAVTTSDQSPITVYLTNSMGRILRKFEIPSVNAIYHFDIKDFPSGLYFFQFISNRNTKSIKAIKR